MPDPTPRQGGWVDPYLTDVALDYSAINADIYIARTVFPQIPVANSHGYYASFPRSYFLRDEVGPRPLGGYPRQVGFRVQRKPFNVEERTLEAFIDDRQRADEIEPVSIEQSSIRLLMQQHLINMDRRWAAAYFKPGVWGSDLTGVASGVPTSTQFLRWDNEDSNPMLEIDEHRDAIGDKVGDAYAPNTLVLGRGAYRALKNHPLILARLGDNNDRMLTKEKLAQFFDIPKVLVPGGIVNTGPEKSTAADTETAAVYSRIVASDDALLVYAAQQPSKEEPSGGYSFAWNSLLGANAANPLAAVERGRDDRAHSDWFQCRTGVDFGVSAPELGVFFNGAVS